MADFLLGSGALVLIDPEDLELMGEGTWRTHFLEGKWRCVRDVMARGHQYRLSLHREVIFRVDPSLVRKADRLNVIPVNGDFLDVRRENLEFRVFPRKPGAPKRARGAARKSGFKNSPTASCKPKQPPAWSRDGCADAAVQRDGCGGGEPAGDSVRLVGG